MDWIIGIHIGNQNMIETLLKSIQREISGQRALLLLHKLTSYHRIQSSPGFREAAGFCEKTARDYGLETEMLTFPADGETSYWGYAVPREWEAQRATLELIEPESEKLADFSESKISLIQRSISARLDSADIVVLRNGLEKSEYKEIDVSGKLVLTEGDIERVRELAVEQFGAAGILFDGIREVKPIRSRLDLPDARQYTSFWWRPGDKRCFGFVLTPRQGDWLRSLSASGKSLKARVAIDSDFRDGTMEVLSCFIPGETLEEVLLIAHLCHPEPSANDNASGCVSVLEAMRTVKYLVDRGDIAPLKRGVRALLLPEWTGSFAYLASHEERIADFVCALNIDMAGENQALCGSTFVVEAPPDACRGFVLELASVIQKRVFRAETGVGGKRDVGQERISAQPFAGGSDHMVLSDPDAGVPCPSLCQWPDKFYHTDMDTPDKVDPAMLSASAEIAACYAAFAANAGETEARWLRMEMISALKRAVTEDIQRELTSGLERGEPSGSRLDALRKRLSYLLERKKEALGHLERLGASAAETDEAREDANEWVRREFAEAERHYLSLLGRAKRRTEKRKEDRLKYLVPSRVIKGPSGCSMVARWHWIKLSKGDREKLWQLLQKHKETPNVFTSLSWYWVNGRRTLAEIADLVEMECGVRDDDLLEGYYNLLEKVGLTRITRKGAKG
jgi:aminopeptidase YwaD